MRGTLSLLSLPCPLWLRFVAPDRALSMGQIEQNCVLILNWIAWNRTVLKFILRTYVKLNCLKWNGFCMLNWIVWNRTVVTKTILILNWIVWNRTVWLNWIPRNRIFLHWNSVVKLKRIAWNGTVFLHKSEIGIKNLQRLIPIKAKQIKQSGLFLYRRVLEFFLHGRLHRHKSICKHFFD